MNASVIMKYFTVLIIASAGLFFPCNAGVAAEPMNVVCGSRTTFYRNEQQSAFTVIVKRGGLAANTRVNAVCHIDPLPVMYQIERFPVTLAAEETRISFQFSPTQLKCGKYPCKVSVTPLDGQPVQATFVITVAPTVRRDHYLLSTWNNGGSWGVPFEEWISFFHTLGINCIDNCYLNNLPFTNRKEYCSNNEQINRYGAEGFLYNFHSFFLTYSESEDANFWKFDYGFSPANRERIRREAREMAEALSVFPNWRGSLINTEGGPGYFPDTAERKAWFDVWAEQQMGFKIPEKGWQLIAPTSPLGCAFPDGKKPGTDGVYAEEPEAYKFLTWWYTTGGPVWQINSLASNEMRKVRPDLINWTDPLIFPGAATDLQAGCTWSYQVLPEDLLAEFESGYSYIRGTGKEYYTTLGMDYCAGSWTLVTTPEGVKRQLMVTPDDLIQQAWLAVTHIPSDGMTLWLSEAWLYGEKDQPIPYAPGQNAYCPPGSTAAFGTVMTRDLLPIGTMLKGVPNAQRTVALLLPESTEWFATMEGGWGWGTYHYQTHWKKWLGQAGLSYDIVRDCNITPGSLAKYSAVIFPMAQYVSKRVFDEVTAAGKAGTKVIVDEYCRQTYPNCEKWPQQYLQALPADKRDDYGKDAIRRLVDLKKNLYPVLTAYAEGDKGSVLVNVREIDGVQYISVVNNCRQSGKYTEWTKRPDFEPYGKTQRATVFLRVPKGSVAYEFTTSRQVQLKEVTEDIMSVELELPPHAGRLLCVYPRQFATMNVHAEGQYACGTAATMIVDIKDAKGQTPPGRQLIDVTITDPNGVKHDESGFYRMEKGYGVIPFRPAINDLTGEWTAIVTERSSGIRAEHKFMVLEATKQ